MNERLIYEWLRGKKVIQVHHLHPRSDGKVEVTYYYDGATHTIAEVPLDMNTWHNEVVPKLLRERIPVAVSTNVGLTAYEPRVGWHCHLRLIVNLETVKGRRTHWGLGLEAGTADEVCYDALTQYLETLRAW